MSRWTQLDLIEWLREAAEGKRGWRMRESYEARILRAAERLEAAQREHDHNAMSEAVADIVSAQRALRESAGESRVERDE